MLAPCLNKAGSALAPPVITTLPAKEPGSPLAADPVDSAVASDAVAAASAATKVTSGTTLAPPPKSGTSLHPADPSRSANRHDDRRLLHCVHVTQRQLRYRAEKTWHYFLSPVAAATDEESLGNSAFAVGETNSSLFRQLRQPHRQAQHPPPVQHHRCSVRLRWSCSRRCIRRRANVFHQTGVIQQGITRCCTWTSGSPPNRSGNCVGLFFGKFSGIEVYGVIHVGLYSQSFTQSARSRF